MFTLQKLGHNHRRLHQRVSRWLQSLIQYKNPLLKQIHPDMFANEGEVVRTANLTCVQNLNEIFRVYQELQQLIESSPTSAVRLTSDQKFQPSYNLSCYFRPMKGATIPTQHVGSLLSLTYSLEVPLLLRKSTLPGVSSKASSTASKTKLNVSVNVFVCRFRQFLRDIGIELDPIQANTDLLKSNEPLQTDRVDAGSDGRTVKTGQSTQKSQEVDNKESDELSKNDEDNLDDLLFERITINSYNRSAHGMFASNKKKSIEYVETEVNYFLAHGHVFMRNVSLQLEIDTTQRFRSFLVKYGELVNFSCHNWGNIMFVFYDLTETERFEKVHSHQNRHSGGSNKRRKVDRKCLYKCTMKDGAYILECPYRFKAQDMIEFLSTHVEITLDMNLS